MANRFVCSVSTAVLLGACAAPAFAQSSPKRGVAGGGPELANALNASWYYHWSNDPNSANANPPHGSILTGGLDGTYTPMIWGGNLNNLQPKIKRILGYKDALNVEHVLGFNEPERPDQSNLSVADAIAMWGVMDAQLAQGAGLKLVSPAVSDNQAGRDWLADFMAQASANNYAVDAVAFHWYGNFNINNPTGAANNFLNRVDDYHNTYGLPVWITEFAAMDWGDQYTGQQMVDFNKAFLEVVIPGLESRSYVERYSWWQFGLALVDPAQEIDTQLFEQVNGVWTPTPIGDVYVETLMEGDTRYLGGASTGKDTIYFRGGLISNGDTASPSTLYAIDAIEGDSEIGAGAGAQTIVSGGTVRIRSGATLTKIWAGDVVFQDVEIINEGELRVRRDMELAGALTFGGDGSGDVIVENNGVLLITGDVSGLHNDLIIQDGGIVNLEPTDAAAMTGGIEVQAGGALRIGAAGQDGSAFPVSPTSFVNNGTVRVYDAETIQNMTGSGLFFAEEEAIALRDNAGYDGEIGVRDGASLRPLNAEGLGTIAGKTVVYGDQQEGVLELASNLTTLAEPLELRGRQQGAINAPHIVNLFGVNNWTGPVTLEVSGTQWTLQSDAGLLVFSGGIVASPGNLSRTLRLTGEGDGLFTAAISMNPAANNTLTKFGGGTWSLNAPVTGLAAAQINAGELAVNDSFDAGVVNINNGGTLTGSGTLAGSVNVRDGGRIDPGSVASRTLTVTQDVDFQTGSTLTFDLDGSLSPGVLYDQLVVGGSLSFDPGVTLEVVLGNGYTPAAGDGFLLLSFSSILGGPDQFILPQLDAGLVWDTSQLTSTGVLGVASATAPADLSGDGDVDDEDLGLFFSAFTGPDLSQGPLTNPAADLSGDGDVDDEDLGGAFGQFTGPLAPIHVPEPTSLAMLGVGALIAARRRRAAMT